MYTKIDISSCYLPKQYFTHFHLLIQGLLVVSIFVPWCFCIRWQQALAVCSYYHLWQPMCELRNAQLCHVTNVQYVRSSWEVNSRTAGKQRTITSTRFSSQCHVCSDTEGQTDSQVNVLSSPRYPWFIPSQDIIWLWNSLQQMKYAIEKDDLTSINERIAAARVNHKANIERIYVAHTEDYLDDQRLRRESHEDYDISQSRSTSGKLAEWSEKYDVRRLWSFFLVTLISMTVTLSAPLLYRTSLWIGPWTFYCEGVSSTCFCYQQVVHEETRRWDRSGESAP